MKRNEEDMKRNEEIIDAVDHLAEKSLKFLAQAVLTNQKDSASTVPTT